MHIRKITLHVHDIKIFDGFCRSLEADEPAAGWHVLLGDNGSGKSSVLRACAIALMGPTAPRFHTLCGSVLRSFCVP